MDAFEAVVSEIFFRRGYWTQTSLKIDLTKEEKREIGRPSSPRWEIDVVAYSGRSNELLALECKSYLDSTGVPFAEISGVRESTRYKLFRENETRKVVLDRMARDLFDKGYIARDCKVVFGLVAGKVKKGDEEQLEQLFAMRGWKLFGPHWVRGQLSRLAQSRYSNEVSSVVSKLLLRQ